MYNFSEEDFRGVNVSKICHLLKGNNDLLSSITQPPMQSKKYTLLILEVGADIVETNIFRNHDRNG
jgi:methionine synthase I (cobalamin-dependent)